MGESNIKNDYVFLATAIVNAGNGSGNSYACRVLLDSGSQLNFITEKLAQELQLSRTKPNVCVTGVGGRQAAVRHRTFWTIHSRVTSFSMPLEAHILSKITERQPNRFVAVNGFPMSNKLPMADPKFNVPQRTDILIGA